MTIDAIDTIDTEVVDRATETPDSESGAAAQRLAELLSPERVDALLADAEASGLAIDGPNGLINQMIKAVLERALDVEMADHLGYDRGDPAGVGSGNSRNGHTSKTVITSAGQTRVEVPRDRNSSFEPQIVPKRHRRLGNTTDMILSLYARGMTTRDIKAHLVEVYGVEVSHETVAKVTDVVADASNDERAAALAPWLEYYNTRRRHSALRGLPPTSRRAWQARPVDEGRFLANVANHRRIC
jgi:Transposase, Mutator family